ncbi:MAG TPA: hypothetical protein VJ623_13255 [Holophagaceae bacterium]|nr:hypothetical protein [Holophagaceae bacterium]
MTDSRLKQTTEVLAVGTALFVSFCTLAVYAYQAKVMKEQQHVSVWPYLEWATGNVKDFHITVKNKGVGPALIQKVEMTLDGKPVHTATELVSAVRGPDWSLQGLINSSLEGRVMSPGEEVSPITITDVTEGRAFEGQLRKHAFQLRITYCSIYGDCWITEGQRVKRQPKVDLGLY